MHLSKELSFTFLKMLTFSRCTVSFNNYSLLYIAHFKPHACFHIIEFIIIFESESFKPSIFQATK